MDNDKSDTRKVLEGAPVIAVERAAKVMSKMTEDLKGLRQNGGLPGEEGVPIKETPNTKLENIAKYNEAVEIFCNSKCGTQRCTLPNACEKLQTYLKQQEQIESIKNQPTVQVMTLVYRAPDEKNSGARFSRLDRDSEKIIMMAATLTQKIFEEGAGTLAIGVSEMLESEYEKIEKKGS